MLCHGGDNVTDERILICIFERVCHGRDNVTDERIYLKFYPKRKDFTYVITIHCTKLAGVLLNRG